MLKITQNSFKNLNSQKILLRRSHDEMPSGKMLRTVLTTFCVAGVVISPAFVFYKSLSTPEFDKWLVKYPRFYQFCYEFSRFGFGNNGFQTILNKHEEIFPEYAETRGVGLPDNIYYKYLPQNKRAQLISEGKIIDQTPKIESKSSFIPTAHALEIPLSYQNNNMDSVNLESFHATRKIDVHESIHKSKLDEHNYYPELNLESFGLTLDKVKTSIKSLQISETNVMKMDRTELIACINNYLTELQNYSISEGIRLSSFFTNTILNTEEKILDTIEKHKEVLRTINNDEILNDSKEIEAKLRSDQEIEYNRFKSYLYSLLRQSRDSILSYYKGYMLRDLIELSNSYQADYIRQSHELDKQSDLIQSEINDKLNDLDTQLSKTQNLIDNYENQKLKNVNLIETVKITIDLMNFLSTGIPNDNLLHAPTIREILPKNILDDGLITIDDLYMKFSDYTDHAYYERSLLSTFIGTLMNKLYIIPKRNTYEYKHSKDLPVLFDNIKHSLTSNKLDDILKIIDTLPDNIKNDLKDFKEGIQNRVYVEKIVEINKLNIEIQHKLVNKNDF